MHAFDDGNLGHFFSATAARCGGRTAVIDLWGGRERRLTYRDLDSRTDKAGALFQSLGLHAGDRLAILLGNRSEFIEIFFGAMRAGLVPVPLNIKQPQAALAYMIADAGCRGAAFDPDALPGAEALVAGLPATVSLSGAGGSPYEAGLASAAALIQATSPDGIAFQPYTAGSTGRPKGVRLTHRGMLWSIRTTQEHWPMGEAETGLVAVPLFHKNAMRGTIKPALYAGATAVVMPQFEPRAYLEALARYRVTFSGGVPALFSMLLEHRDLLDRLDFSALESLAIGSAIVPVELVKALERVFPNAKVKESYGLTEGGGPLRAPRDGRVPPRGSCGVEADGYEVTLVDETGRRGAETGELWTRSPCVTAGYHNLPELTRERIVDGWLRTGDMFSKDADGFFHFMGRADDMFSCGGENIYPKEVEDVLLAHPDVRDVCVAPVPHAVKGFVPAAMVVPQAGARVDAATLKAFALANGPAYAHPRLIVLADALPLSGAGKPDRKAVQARLEAETRQTAET